MPYESLDTLHITQPTRGVLGRSTTTRAALASAAMIVLASAAGCAGKTTLQPNLGGTDIVEVDGASEGQDAPLDTFDDTAGDAAGDAVGDAEADAATDADLAEGEDTTLEPVSLRVATFNASLFRAGEGDLLSGLSAGDDGDTLRVAAVLQHIRPDVVLINEFDWDAEGESARVFAEQYLAVGQEGAEPIEYGYRYVPTTNTGLHSGVDLDGNGEAVSTPGSQAYGNDAFGFGLFPGQYGMVILSRYPIDAAAVRSFQTLRWADMPDNLLPGDYYSAEAAAAMRLSSKNHVDVPVQVEGHTLHVLASHPTPPSFDGPEDRNGRRNHDEIRLWVDYLTGGDAAAYLQDDAGVSGGLEPSAHFVVLGDLNSDPQDGDSRREALAALLSHPRVQDPQPESDGAEEAHERDGRANTTHNGNPRLDTADFNDNRVGNLRVDYALPSASLQVAGAGVFWPLRSDALAPLATVSDHHLVWVDIEISAQ